MNIRPLGIDIGASTIKAVWFSQPQKDMLALAAAVIAPTPPKGMLSESPIDEEEMARVIRQIVLEAKITTKTVNVALPENKVYTKVLEMPTLSDKELASAIYWEAEQYIPVDLNTVTLDWKVLKKPETQVGTEKMQVLLVGAPTSLIEKYQRVFSLAGMSIQFVETEILSIIRALVFPSVSKQMTFPNSIIVNIGAMSTSLAIIKDGLLVFTYSVAIGGSAINRAIAADFGFSLSQAEEYKKTYGLTNQTVGDKISASAKPILVSLAQEVKKALAFYKEKYKNEAPLVQILLAGGTAKLPGIDLFFAQECGIETATANPWLVLDNQQVPKEIIDNSCDYAIAVGLALRDYE